MVHSRCNSFSSMLVSIFLCVIAQTIHASGNKGFCYTSLTKDELARKLWGSGSNYTEWKLTRPSVAKLITETPKANPTLANPDVVKIGIEILAIKKIDELKNEVVIQLITNHYWNDYRLNYETEVNCLDERYDYYEMFSMADFPSVWKPDTYIMNLVENPTDLKSSFYVYPNGNVKFRQHSILHLSCKLNVHHFPYDTQSCPIVFSSINGMNDTSYVHYEQPVITHESDLIADTTEWIFEDYQPKSNNYNPNPQKSLTFSIEMKRKVDYYNYFVILPVFLMVFIGWLVLLMVNLKWLC